MHLANQLALSRCPYCGVDTPTMSSIHAFQTKAFDGSNERRWVIYSCQRCGGVVSAAANMQNSVVREHHPTGRRVDDSIPEVPREYLAQALNSRHAPAGAVMLAATAVDSMLKNKGYVNGSLYSRIDQAVADHIITADMGAWAHDVRLEANGQRHADGDFSIPTSQDADRVVDFAQALAQFLFVLPARVRSGREQASA